MAQFDLFEIKKKLDAERMERNVNRKETIGQKILMVIVTIITLLLIYSLLLTFNMNDLINKLIAAIFVVLVILRIVQVSKRK